MRIFIFFLYRLLLVLAFPLILLYFLYRLATEKGYRANFVERIGTLPPAIKPTKAGTIWLHAVSVGEVATAQTLIARIRKDLPGTEIYVSVSTVAGRKLAADKLQGQAEGVFYAPIDYVWIVRKVLRRLRPQLLIVMETEIWPNLFRQARVHGCGVMIANGRISDRALPKYLRYRWFFWPVLRQAHLIYTQSEENARRYKLLGAPPEITSNAGNLKYDFDPKAVQPPAVIQDFLTAAAPSHVWIAASTMPPAEADDPDEDDIVFDTYQKLKADFPRLLLIHVPRRPEGFDVAAAKLDACGINYVRRSQLPGNAAAQVLLLDSIGELSSIFALADVVFMGGTFPHRGGHNILEPAFAAKPVVAGPHMENFADIAEEFTQGRALIRVAAPSELATAIANTLNNPGDTGDRAKALAEAKRGATERAANAAITLYENSLWKPPGSLWGAPFAWIWRMESSRRMRHTARGRLNTPVISVGGISMGGTGKTPFVLWLAQQLDKAGLQPAILTRGYRRRIPAKHTLIAKGEQAAPALTGDEAQIYLRARAAPVAIGKDRYETGCLVEERFHPKVMLLDDGFQHWRLARDFDIVMIDALDPFGGNGHVFPRGRLREPLTALARAAAIVVTRTEPHRTYAAVVNKLRRYNTTAPVYFSRVKPKQWIELRSHQTAPQPPAVPVAAICGLANPASFFHTLKQLNIQPAYQWAFGDHHQYKAVEMRRLRHQAKLAGAQAVLTTEKDAANFSAEALDALQLPIWYLEIEMEIEGGDQLVESLKNRFSSHTLKH